MARTILHEERHIKPEVIEHQLAHKVPDANGSAYNRTKFPKERKAMMQLWADCLDKLKAGRKSYRCTAVPHNLGRLRAMLASLCVTNYDTGND